MSDDLDLDKYLGGRFIRGKDVADGGILLTVADIEERTFRDGTTKPVLTFKEDERIASLGPQNLRRLMSAFGDRTSKWMGQTVLLMAGPEFQGNPSLLIMKAPIHSNGKAADDAKSEDMGNDVIFGGQ